MTLFSFPLTGLEPRTWYAQAVARRSLDSPRPGVGAGDLFGEVVSFELTDEGPGTVELVLSKVVEAQPIYQVLLAFDDTKAAWKAFNHKENP